MTEYLKEKGWRQIGSQGSIKYWDHPRHQPNERGAFITTDAFAHQKEYDKNGWCDCIDQLDLRY